VTPRLSDLDINGHVNNAQLLGWTLEPLPLEVSGEQVLREIDVQFRHECRRDDRIAARVEAKDGGVFHHSVIFVDNGRELVRARSVWRP
jgi:acyl-ACP thioesterase